MTAKEILKTWFSTGKRPTGAQFAEWMDSYWHKADLPELPELSGMLEAHTENANLHFGVLEGNIDSTFGRAAEGVYHDNDTIYIVSYNLTLHRTYQLRIDSKGVEETRYRDDLIGGSDPSAAGVWSDWKNVLAGTVKLGTGNPDPLEIANVNTRLVLAYDYGAFLEYGNTQIGLDDSAHPFFFDGYHNYGLLYDGMAEDVEFYGAIQATNGVSIWGTTTFHDYADFGFPAKFGDTATFYGGAYFNGYNYFNEAAYFNEYFYAYGTAYFEADVKFNSYATFNYETKFNDDVTFADAVNFNSNVYFSYNASFIGDVSLSGYTYFGSTTEFGSDAVFDGDIILKPRNKIFGTRASDYAQEVLIELGEYGTYEQTEVGSEARPLCLNHNSQGSDGTAVGKNIIVNYKDGAGAQQADAVAYLSDVALPSVEMKVEDSAIWLKINGEVGHLTNPRINLFRLRRKKACDRRDGPHSNPGWVRPARHIWTFPKYNGGNLNKYIINIPAGYRPGEWFNAGMTSETLYGVTCQEIIGEGLFNIYVYGIMTKVIYIKPTDLNLKTPKSAFVPLSFAVVSDNPAGGYPLTGDKCRFKLLVQIVKYVDANTFEVTKTIRVE